ELEQLKRRIHILEGFRVVFNDLDEALKIIRESAGKQDAGAKLIKAFKLDEEQAGAILDAQLYKIAQMEIKKILDELKEKKARALQIEGILASQKKLWGVVKDELGQVEKDILDDVKDEGEKKKYTAMLKRRTKVGGSADVPEFDPEAYIVRENTNVVLTRDG